MPKIRATTTAISKEVLEQVYAEAEARLEGRFKERIARLEKQCRLYEEAEDAWRKRFFRMEEQYRQAAGQLSLRDAEIKELKVTIEKQNIQIADLRKKIFGPTSEQDALVPENIEPSSSKDSRKRGKQKGAKGNGRKLRTNLPVDEEIIHDGESTCSVCGVTTDTMSYEESEEVEVNVRAYRRKHLRRKYGHFCTAKNKYVIEMAPVPPKLFPKAMFGIDFWIFILTGKYYLQTPINRLRLQLEMDGLFVSDGTIAAGLERLLPLYKPLYDRIKLHTRQASHWHIDDTGWKVFVEKEGKDGYGWYLWVFVSQDTCLYVLDQSRARSVPKAVLKNSCGIATSDRLQANKKLSDNITNSFCWVHERREFISLSKILGLESTANSWLQLIGNLFHYNGIRLLNDSSSSAYQAAEKKLRETLKTMQSRRDKQLASPAIHPELKRVLTGIKTDWEGLTLFVDFPMIPPDNNRAERALRNPVVGRKNYYGSGSESSAEMAAVMFTIFQTLLIHKIDIKEFNRRYLQACAANNGKAPSQLKSFLPWNWKPIKSHQ
jgi:transposase